LEVIFDDNVLTMNAGGSNIGGYKIVPKPNEMVVNYMSPESNNTGDTSAEDSNRAPKRKIGDAGEEDSNRAPKRNKVERPKLRGRNLSSKPVNPVSKPSIGETNMGPTSNNAGPTSSNNTGPISDNDRVNSSAPTFGNNTGPMSNNY